MNEGTTEKRRRVGRPAGPKTVRVVALLLLKQKGDLEFLSATMEGNPPVARLIREAVKQYVDRKMENKAIQTAYAQTQKRKLRVIS